MPDLVRLEGVTVKVHGKELLTEANIVLEHGRRYALIGRNGVGKSSLLKKIARSTAPEVKYDRKTQAQRHKKPVGRRKARQTHTNTPDDIHHEVDSGIETWPTHVSVYMVAQEAKLTERSVEEVVSESHLELQWLYAQEDALEQSTAPDAAQRLQQICNHLQDLELQSIDMRVDSALAQVGLTKNAEKPVSSLSGGWRMRVAIACAIVNDPDVLILDEPCNHLDIPSIVWLQEFLVTYPGTAIIVSHDKHFVNAVCTDVMHFFNYSLKYFQGGFDEYWTARTHKQVKMENVQKKIDKERKHMLAVADRLETQSGGKHGNQKLGGMVASRRKKALRHGWEKTESGRRFKMQEHSIRIGSVYENKQGWNGRKMQSGKVTGPQEQDVRFVFPSPPEMPAEHSPLITLNNVSFSYHPTPTCVQDYVFTDVSVTVHPNSRLAILGYNGTGKSTLMDMMRGSKVPSPLLSEHADAMWNTVSFHRNLVISEFAQHHVDQLDHTLNPVQQMQTIFPELDGKLTDTRQYLGKYGITKTLGTQLIGTMSGGQKTRVALAIVTFNRPHVLLLDEPTNHLDQHSIEALIEGIKSFEGAVVVVSHDRQLIQESMKEFIVVKANKKKKVKLSKKQKKRKKQGLDITTATESTKSSNTGLPQSRVVLYKKTFADYLKSISTK